MFRFLREYLLIKYSGYFDERYYLLNNPDVRQADVSPLIHYIQHGWREGRIPSAQFEESLKTRSGVNSGETNPLVQFIQQERQEKSTSKSKFFSLLTIVLKGILFLIKLKGTVIFGGYPYPERERDGYYQRIRSVDNILSQRWRVYIDSVNLPGREFWYDIPTEKVLVIRPNRIGQSNRLAKFATILCIIRCRVLYFHSILSIPKLDILWKIPGLTKILDFHGVVPEEFRLQGDSASSDYFNKIEKDTISRIDYCVVVSETMRNHIVNKYNREIMCRFITLPIYQKIAVGNVRKYIEENKKPLIIYTGGLQEWQQIPKMIQVIKETAGFADYMVFCPEPGKFLELLPEGLKNNPSLVVDSKHFSEIIALYQKCQYGFILREDIIVNHVACPTKLIEYLATGVIPIVDSENIGDFKNLGMRFIHYSNLLKCELPQESEREAMAIINYGVYQKYSQLYESGVMALVELIIKRKPLLN